MKTTETNFCNLVMFGECPGPARFALMFSPVDQHPASLSEYAADLVPCLSYPGMKSVSLSCFGSTSPDPTSPEGRGNRTNKQKQIKTIREPATGSQHTETPTSICTTRKVEWHM